MTTQEQTPEQQLQEIAALIRADVDRLERGADAQLDSRQVVRLVEQAKAARAAGERTGSLLSDAEQAQARADMPRWRERLRELSKDELLRLTHERRAAQDRIALFLIRLYSSDLDVRALASAHLHDWRRLESDAVILASHWFVRARQSPDQRKQAVVERQARETRTPNPPGPDQATWPAAYKGELGL